MASTRQSSVAWSTYDSVLGNSIDGYKYATITEFKPTWKLYLTFGTLCTLVFAAALDGTSLGTALPVRYPIQDI